MSVAPLASRMRPRTLDEYSGQRHLLAPGLLLRRAIDADRIQSLIFFGPPGTGKTTLAQIIAARSKSRFEKLNAVESNLAEMRRVLQGANHRLRNTGESTLLFIDEIHRFNRAQQDVLLPDVESGAVKLIGATTHNPFFFINSPLVSRSQVFELRALEESDLLDLLRRALSDSERGLGHLRIETEPEALAHLARVSDGDARKALNSIEIAAMTTPPGSDGVIRIDRSVAEECIQRKAVVYDGDGDAHYDTISAFIKSMRGSDPDATLYWLAKMIHAGEDPRFIARRIMIHAAEDVGLADPMALVLATAACQAAEVIGPVHRHRQQEQLGGQSHRCGLGGHPFWPNAGCAEPLARRPLRRIQGPRPRRRLPLRPRLSWASCRARLSGGSPSFLRTQHSGA